MSGVRLVRLVRLDMLWFLILLRILWTVVKLIIKIYWQRFGWVKGQQRCGLVGGLVHLVPV